MTRKNLGEILCESEFWDKDGNYDGERFESTEADVCLELEQTKLVICTEGVFAMSFNYNEVDWNDETGSLVLRKGGHILI
jgi:hypothetical protein